MRLLFTLILLLCVSPVIAQDFPDKPVISTMQLGDVPRGWCRNPDGSCVQCSISMVGFHANDPRAYTLLWDSPYGSAVRGGSWPARVANYCNQRGIKAWNITGYENTDPWMRWAVKTGRYAAIGAGRAHFQTLYGYDYSDKKWLVCNNNSTHRIDRYDEGSFRNLHLASGPWVVVLQKPSSENPVIVEWWK